jgi:hypothetical protein
MSRLVHSVLSLKSQWRTLSILGGLAIAFSASTSYGQSAGQKLLGGKAKPVSRTVTRPVSQTAEQAPVQTSVESSGPAAGQSVGHRRCCNRPEVFLLRGGAGYWPRVGNFEETLRSRGFEPKTIYHWQFRGLADEIATAYHAGELAGPVTIVGYSSGADAGCWMCERLNKANVPVTTLVLIESTFGISVPSNVNYCFNIYESRGWTDKIPAFRGIPVETRGQYTHLDNVDVKYHSELGGLSDLNHFTMGVNSRMHTMLADLLVQRNQQLQQPAQQPASEGETFGAGEAAASRDEFFPNGNTVRK